MKILLVAINAKYIHSNLAVYSLRACAGQWKEQIEIAEYTINHQKEEILADIYQKKPDLVAFSCYIWNREYVISTIENLHLVLPEMPIWVGGPEVSYDAASFLKEYPQVTGVLTGEGERSFSELAEAYGQGKTAEETEILLEGIKGLVYRKEEEICTNPPAELMNLDEIPFVYEDMADFEHKIIYYESSRGCPFSCSYCLSSIDKKVRFRSLDLVLRELQFFLDAKVPQVKFVDRTFNCSHSHATAIWKYLAEHDNGITNFHFEISADLLNEEELELLSTLRPGLAQLEIGVQSVNPETIKEIHRTMNLEELKRTVARVHRGNNIHHHLDLIAGLPFEDYESFVYSFNEVYQMKPQQLQLGFLKVLKGSWMHQHAKEYGIVYRAEPPYEVLYSNWISYDEILKLKAVEEMVEVYYNSCQFVFTLKELVKLFPHPFAMYEAMAEYYEREDLNGRNHSRMGRFEILRTFIQEVTQEDMERFEELLLLDLYLRENSKSRPKWGKDLSGYKNTFREFYQKEAETPDKLPGYEGFQSKQMMNMTHGEVFTCDIMHRGGEGPWLAVFDYKNRDPLTGNAKMIWI